MSHKEEISKCARLNGFQEIFSDLQKYAIPKGQNFSEGNCGIQKTNSFFPDFCPKCLKWVKYLEGLQSNQKNKGTL